MQYMCYDRKAYSSSLSPSSALGAVFAWTQALALPLTSVALAVVPSLISRCSHFLNKNLRAIRQQLALIYEGLKLTSPSSP